MCILAPQVFYEKINVWNADGFGANKPEHDQPNAMECGPHTHDQSMNGNSS